VGGELIAVTGVLPNAAGAGEGTDALMVMVGGAGAAWDILDFFLLEVMG
jgi:hypothetical protein